ncbi:SOS response-associated peptidase family protein [Methylomonas sp. LL1]|uniref:SOS response-associated peptidase family protein n=1 Tax=Methylomonas sp. LL1 TaxID=2785785 RepID=UPI0018C3B4C3|nr:SOS response-associated peptidase family protein [Methylomonas sp. LL1]QPK62567.1 SOS response-associated peptidase family protein [Methylomonas sp. LL1]
MCGRYQLTATPESIVDHFQLQRPPRFQSSYNIAPAQKILTIVELDDHSRKAVNLFWGLVPSWAKDAKNSSHLINARVETVREKPSFRSAFKHRRCLISLFDAVNAERSDQLMSALDKINRRHGKNSVCFGSELVSDRWRMRQQFKSASYTTKWDELLTISI